MPSLEGTAYPRFGRVIAALELERSYTPTEEELAWIAPWFARQTSGCIQRSR
jgi:hypothetical protein